jgi:hypothetical protein
MWQGENSRWHLAIRRRSIKHRYLIERRREAQTRAFREEDDVVLTSIGVSDERTEGIKPPKAASIFICKTSSVPQYHGRASPWIDGVVVNRRQTQKRATRPRTPTRSNRSLSRNQCEGVSTMFVCAAEMPNDATTFSASASSTSRSHQRLATTLLASPRAANSTSMCRPSTTTPNWPLTACGVHQLRAVLQPADVGELHEAGPRVVRFVAEDAIELRGVRDDLVNRQHRVRRRQQRSPGVSTIGRIAITTSGTVTRIASTVST